MSEGILLMLKAQPSSVLIRRSDSQCSSLISSNQHSHSSIPPDPRSLRAINVVTFSLVLRKIRCTFPYCCYIRPSPSPSAIKKMSSQQNHNHTYWLSTDGSTRATYQPVARHRPQGPPKVTYCCQCNSGPMSIKLHPQCVACDHRICTGCPKE